MKSSISDHFKNMLPSKQKLEVFHNKKYILSKIATSLSFNNRWKQTILTGDFQSITLVPKSCAL